MTEWYSVANTDTIDSPALLVYPDRVRENIRILKQFVPDTSRLRPHVKTNKCAEVCQMMMEAGIHKFKCATIAEAEMLALLKAPDVLLAYQPLGPKAIRLIELIKKFPGTSFSCVLDTADAATFLNEQAKKENIVAHVFIDLNVGMNRTGITPGDAFPLFRVISTLSNLKFAGLHAYDGHLRDADLEERRKKCNDGFAGVEQLRQKIEKETNSTIVVVAGGTPSFPIHATRTDVECSPGTFIFWDSGYGNLLKEQPFLFAALVMTRIISLPTGETITTDLGHKAIASENPITSRVHFLNAPELQAIGHSEEHLVLKAPTGHGYRVGDVLYGVPYHVCPTIALHETMIPIDNHVASGSWPVVSRKRKITV